MVLFNLGNEKYAIDMHQVISIEYIEEISSLANINSYIAGITEIRNKLTTLINLSEILLVDKTSQKLNKNKIIVINFNEQFIGLLVEEVTDVMEISKENIQSLGVKSTNDLNYVSGIAQLDHHLIIILNLDQLLSTMNFNIEELANNE